MGLHLFNLLLMITFLEFPFLREFDYRHLELQPLECQPDAHIKYEMEHSVLHNQFYENECQKLIPQYYENESYKLIPLLYYENEHQKLIPQYYENEFYKLIPNLLNEKFVIFKCTCTPQWDASNYQNRKKASLYVQENNKLSFGFTFSLYSPTFQCSNIQY